MQALRRQLPAAGHGGGRGRLDPGQEIRDIGQGAYSSVYQFKEDSPQEIKQGCRLAVRCLLLGMGRGAGGGFVWRAT